jgi:hypothetical protein
VSSVNISIILLGFLFIFEDLGIDGDNIKIDLKELRWYGMG